jgi:hypothetical protein
LLLMLIVFALPAEASKVIAPVLSETEAGG